MLVVTTTEQEDQEKLNEYYTKFKNSEDIIKTKRQAKREATRAICSTTKEQCYDMFKGYDHNNPESSAKTTICWKVNEAIIKYWNDNNSDKPINNNKVTQEAFLMWKATQKVPDTNQQWSISWEVFRKTFKTSYDHFNNDRCREDIWKKGAEKKLVREHLKKWKVNDDDDEVKQIAVASSDNNQKFFIYRILAEQYDSYDPAVDQPLSLDELYKRISKLRYQLGGNYRTHTHQGTLEEVMRGTSLHKDSKESNSKLFMINLDTNFATAFENYMTERKFVKKDFQNIFINYDAYTVSQVKPKRKRDEIEDENNSLKKQKQDVEEEKQKLEVENKKLKKQKRKVEKNVWNHKEFMLKMLPTKPCLLEYASSELKNDPDIVKIAVKTNGTTLKYASEDLKNNEKIVKKVKHIFINY